MAVAPTKTVRAHCPTCGPDRNARVLCEHEESWGDDEAVGTSHYRVLKCAGCDRVFVQREEIEFDVDRPDRSRSFYWPSAVVHSPPRWINRILERDDTLYELLQETYEALNDDLRVTAALAMRTAFDRASELLGIDPALPFSQKLSELHQRGRIGKEEQDSLSALVDAGSAAAHRAWRPSVEQLKTMISIVEGFLHHTLLLNKDAQKLKHGVPGKPPRKAR